MTTPGSDRPVEADFHTAMSVTSFLDQEADLLDRVELEEWLGLWCADPMYVVPIDWAQPDPAADEFYRGPGRARVCIVYDDRARLEQRIRRLRSQYNWTQNPPVRSQRMISSVVLHPAAAGECIVTSKFMLALYRMSRGEVDVLAGHLHHRLEMLDGGGFRILGKIATLINCDASLEDMSVLF